jgi:hypothetical protein
MKKTLIAAACALALAVFLLVPMSVWASPAVVIMDFGCGLLDGNGGFAFTYGTIEIDTSSGNTTEKCHASGVPNDTGTAVHWDITNTGLECGTESGALTPDWHETVSADGEATLTCVVHN